MLAFEFLVLTAARSGEVRNARWEQIDRDGAVWTIPAERMKTGRAHRVPFSPRALEVLDGAAELFDRAGPVFPSPTGRVLNHAALTNVLHGLGIDVLMTRSCTWAGDNPQAWDLEMLAHPAELPEELRLAVLGARSRVLFVEGSSTSLDLPLYDTLFPELSVVPRGTCVDVERAVRGLRDTEDRHHVEAYGIVDRDDLEHAAVDKLAGAGIFALAVRSVESLYYCSDAMQAVARHQTDSMGLDAEILARSAKRDALAALAPEEVIQRMAARRCEHRMRDTVLGQLPDWRTIRSTIGPTIDLHVPSAYADEVAQFRRLLAGDDFDALVARYPLRETGAFGAITKALKCASLRDYEQMVVVRTAKDDALATALTNRLRPLAEAITPATARS